MSNPAGAVVPNFFSTISGAHSNMNTALFCSHSWFDWYSVNKSVSEKQAKTLFTFRDAPLEFLALFLCLIYKVILTENRITLQSVAFQVGNIYVVLFFFKLSKNLCYRLLTGTVFPFLVLKHVKYLPVTLLPPSGARLYCN